MIPDNLAKQGQQFEVGIYQVYVIGDSCDDTLHEAKGEMFITDANESCGAASFSNIELYADGHPEVRSGPASAYLAGANNISYCDQNAYPGSTTKFSAITNEFVDSAQGVYCVAMTGGAGSWYYGHGEETELTPISAGYDAQYGTCA